MSSPNAGWGNGWGTTLWGDNTDASLELLIADAVADNRVRLVFNRAPSFTQLMDAHDGSRPEHYTVTADVSTFGRDGLVARDVNVIAVEQRLDLEPLGHLIDVIVDRTFSPYPAIYSVAVADLVTDTDGEPLNPTMVSYAFFGCSRAYIPPSPEMAVGSRDLANPQTIAMLGDENGDQTPSELGTYPVDTTGDYATDEGLSNLKSRVFRRLVSMKSAFLHAQGYGVGVTDSLKRLNIPAIRDAIAADAENQIAQEPDVKRVKVIAKTDANMPNIVRFFIYVQTVQGLAVKFEAPFNSA